MVNNASWVVRVSICNLPDSLSLKVVQGMLCSFSHWHLNFLHAVYKLFSMNHGSRRFLDSESAYGAELVEVKNSQH